MSRDDFLAHHFDGFFAAPRNLQEELAGGDLDLAYVAAQALATELADLKMTVQRDPGEGTPGKEATEHGSVTVHHMALSFCCQMDAISRKMASGFQTIMEQVSFPLAAVRPWPVVAVGDPSQPIRAESMASALTQLYLFHVGIILAGGLPVELQHLVSDRLQDLVPRTGGRDDWSPVILDDWDLDAYRAALNSAPRYRTRIVRIGQALRSALDSFDWEEVEVELDKEFALATAFRRQLGLPNRPAVSEASRTAQSLAVNNLEKKQRRAMALLVTQPDISVTELARTMEVDRRTLYNWPKVRACLLARKAGKWEMPKGYVRDDGTLEAHE